MTLGFQKLLTPLLCLVLLKILSGCYLLGELAWGAAVTAQPRDPNSHRTGEDHYEPEILASNENIIRIKYLSVGPNAEHKQVKQLMSKHCQGAYIETSRVELRGYDTVEAECTHGTESFQ